MYNTFTNIITKKPGKDNSNQKASNMGAQQTLGGKKGPQVRLHYKLDSFGGKKKS